MVTRTAPADGESEAFSFSAWPYSCADIDKAKHVNELPRVMDRLPSTSMMAC